jgi:hypothetical protein
MGATSNPQPESKSPSGGTGNSEANGQPDLSGSTQWISRRRIFYPPKFSDEACAAVEAELARARAALEADLIRAGRLGDERKRKRLSEWSIPERQSLIKCIMSVFLTYAHAAIELGKSNVWRVDQVRRQALEGLETIAMRVATGRDCRKLFITWRGDIRPEAQRDFEATTEWREFKDELLALAERQAARNPQQSTPVVAIPDAPRIATDGDAHREDKGTAPEDTDNTGINSRPSSKQDVEKRPSKERKGDLGLLVEKRLVNFQTAEQYLGISERQRQNLMNSGALRTEGAGHNRKITVESLLACLPQENPN